MPTTKGPLHPSVQQFKEFVNHHPKMVHEVRSGHKTWQQFYEEWYLLGEEDPIWATYRPDGAPAFSSVKENKKEKDNRTEEEKTADVMGQMLSFFKKFGRGTNAEPFSQCDECNWERATSYSAISR
ncbi:cytoplasmic protein [Bacillus thuringiensis serovar kurstaki str. HD73]|nr:cytoplasmic protein [Bacillus thuringiensis serovar kurstaki str. HD73]